MHTHLKSVTLSLVCLLGACSLQPAQSPAQKAHAEKVHDYVMSKVPGYGKETNTKAMAACVVWGTDDQPTNVELVRWYRVGGTSDVLIGTTQLMNSAMLACTEARREEGRTCDCRQLARNDTNVLTVP